MPKAKMRQKARNIGNYRISNAKLKLNILRNGLHVRDYLAVLIIYKIDYFRFAALDSSQIFRIIGDNSYFSLPTDVVLLDENFNRELISHLLQGAALVADNSTTNVRGDHKVYLARLQRKLVAGFDS